MAKIIIVDASVVYKWLIDEPGEETKRARKLRDRYSLESLSYSFQICYILKSETY